MASQSFIAIRRPMGQMSWKKWRQSPRTDNFGDSFRCAWGFIACIDRRTVSCGRGSGGRRWQRTSPGSRSQGGSTRKERKHAEAIDLYEQAVKLATKAYGADDLETARLMNRLGLRYYIAYQYTKAEAST
jgi:hypothetical protein